MPPIVSGSLGSPSPTLVANVPNKSLVEPMEVVTEKKSVKTSNKSTGLTKYVLNVNVKNKMAARACKKMGLMV